MGLRVIVVGMGVQGAKRASHAGDDLVACVEPVGGHDFDDIRDVPLDSYDAALLCVPDQPKIYLLTYLAENGKHALVEKPLWSENDLELSHLQAVARANETLIYTAYNHRFEPHFVRMRDLLQSGALGRIYRCRMFYGNGTARLVRESEWRDQGSGVLHDLGSHLLDTIDFWFGRPEIPMSVISSASFENRAPDHVVIGNDSASPQIELEMTLLNWRNHFTADVFAENGSAHISSLCKWGPSSFIRRTRILPSGRPSEEEVTLVQDDPTWAAEYAHFVGLCDESAPTDLSRDLWLHQELERLSQTVVTRAAQ